MEKVYTFEELNMAELEEKLVIEEITTEELENDVLFGTCHCSAK